MVCEIDGIGARLERAKENVVDLTGEISTFLRLRCDGLVACELAIPSRLGALAGESIYLMRSALDHLAWQLVIAGGGEPGPGTAFPVFASDPARNNQSLTAYNRCVEGMSDTAKARIKTLQPYHRHGWLKRNALWILDDMSTTDQHTALALRFNKYRQQRIPAVLGGVAAVDVSGDVEGAPYLSFASFGKLTDVAVVDGLWLLWHATHGICGSFAAELTGPLAVDPSGVFTALPSEDGNTLVDT